MFVIFSKRSILGGRFAYKKEGSAAEIKKKLKTTGPVKLPLFAVRETEAQGKLKQGKGACPKATSKLVAILVPRTPATCLLFPSSRLHRCSSFCYEVLRSLP